MTESENESPLEKLVALPVAIASELGSLLPRLGERSRRQVEFVERLLEQTGCAETLQRVLGRAQEQAEHLADVVPFPIPHADSAATPETLVDAGESVAASKKKAPAKKAPAKKKSPAKKAPAKKKAPARKATAKKKSPASKSPAKKKSPASKSPATRTAPANAGSPATVSGSGGAAGLGIEGYDALAASQVIPRLDALSPDELEAVRLHESAGRGRRTILNRVAQLQAG